MELKEISYTRMVGKTTEQIRQCVELVRQGYDVAFVGRHQPFLDYARRLFEAQGLRVQHESTSVRPCLGLGRARVWLVDLHRFPKWSRGMRVRVVIDHDARTATENDGLTYIRALADTLEIQTQMEAMHS